MVTSRRWVLAPLRSGRHRSSCDSDGRFRRPGPTGSDKGTGQLAELVLARNVNVQYRKVFAGRLRYMIGPNSARSRGGSQSLHLPAAISNVLTTRLSTGSMKHKVCGSGRAAAILGAGFRLAKSARNRSCQWQPPFQSGRLIALRGGTRGRAAPTLRVADDRPEPRTRHPTPSRERRGMHIGGRADCRSIALGFRSWSTVWVFSPIRAWQH